MTSVDGGGVMPRVVTRFGCASNDGVLFKFLAEKIRESMNSEVSDVVSFVSWCWRLYVSQFLGFVGG
jgi:hypothetical protein